MASGFTSRSARVGAARQACRVARGGPPAEEPPGGQHGVTPEPPVASAARRARRDLAQRLHAELTGPPPPLPGHDLVSAVGLLVPVDAVDGLRRALAAAPAAAARRSPGSVLVAEGPGGTVLRLHGEGFSVVFRTVPHRSPVLVLLDELPGYAVRVDTDPQACGLVEAMIAGVLAGLAKHHRTDR